MRNINSACKPIFVTLLISCLILDYTRQVNFCDLNYEHLKYNGWLKLTETNSLSNVLLKDRLCLNLLMMVEY